MKKISLLVSIVLFVFSTLCFSDTIHVPGDQPTIQDGIDAAVNGDTVLVAPGTYVENINFSGKAITLHSSGGAGVTVIDGGSPAHPNLGSVVTFNSGEGVDAILDGFTITNGTGTFHGTAYPKCGGGIDCSFSSSPTITNTTISGNTANYGGGIFCSNFASPIITNTTITGNTVIYQGGGIFCIGCSPTITNTTITGNTAQGYGDGGGIYCLISAPTIMNTMVSGNTAYEGGGIYCMDSSPTITDSIISGNDYTGIHCKNTASPNITNTTISENSGGGIICEYGSAPAITDSTIIGNTGFYGGGIDCFHGHPIITNCTFAGNTAEERGGAIALSNLSKPIITNSTFMENTADCGGAITCYHSSPTLTNVTFTGNSAQDSGGAVYCWYSSYLTFTNTTFTGNSANIGGGIACYYHSTLAITDAILWDNYAQTGPEIWIGDTPVPSTVYISYSDVEGGQSSVHVYPGCTLDWGAGMIDADPRFAAGADGCYYVRHIAAGQASNSPCIDAGSDLASNLGMDALWTRTDGVADTGTVDMGFHYGAFSSPWTAPLYPDAYTVSETVGGSVNFFLDVGAEKANRNYILLGGASGTDPGYALPGGQATLPLNFDIFTTNTVLPLINTYIFSNFMGTLDANGQATAQLNLPPVIGYAGVKTYYAYCLGWPWEYASNSVEIEIVP